MAAKEEILDSVPTMKRRAPAIVQPQAKSEEIGPTETGRSGDSAEPSEAAPRNTPLPQSSVGGSLMGLRAAARPNAKGAVNLLLSPELKGRLDAANYASRVPRVQIVMAALDEYLAKHGY